MRQSLRTGAWLLRMSWRQSRFKTAAALLLILGKAVSVPLLALALRWLTNAALAGDLVGAWLAGFAVSAFAMAALTFGHFSHIAYFELSEINALLEDERLIALANGSAGIEHQERPDYADKVVVLEREIQQIRNGLYAVLSLLSLILGIGLTGVMLMMVNPILLLLPLIAIPPLVTGQRAQAIEDRARQETASDLRLASHLFHMATGAGPAKELRVSRLADEIERRHDELWERASRKLWRAQAGASVLRAIGQLVFAAGYVAGILLVVNDAISGHRSVGDVVLAITLAAQVNQQVSFAVGFLHDLGRIARAHVLFDWLERQVAASSPQAADLPVPRRLADGIRLRDVSFRYPDTERLVLEGVNLHIPAGSTVAIVGENGAGKSTLVKLLCRFYEPTSGTISVDGLDLARMPVAAWRERVAASFQDFARFELVARQTVGVGSLAVMDRPLVAEAALDRAGACDMVSTLEEGLSTQLGKSYAGGMELSGGQWQKLALGRAMMREEPLVLVLDEPTAALDAEAEHILFERYAEGARRVGRGTGGITLLVSHRFSTVRMADLIVVVADGKVAEVGSHAQLVRQCGLYAEMYGIQAGAYGEPAQTYRPVRESGRPVAVGPGLPVMEPATRPDRHGRDGHDDHEGQDGNDGYAGRDRTASGAIGVFDLSDWASGLRLENLPDGLAWLRTRDEHGGRAWLGGLNPCLRSCVTSWGLALGRPIFGGTTSLVADVTLANGTPAVLKIQYADRECENEAAALSVWSGNGAARLMAYDPRQHALLIERCTPGTQLVQADLSAAQKLDTLIDISRRLCVPAGEPFGTLEDEAAFWVTRVTNLRQAGLWETYLSDAAVDALRAVGPTQGKQVLLNMDVTLRNTLGAERQAWLIVDPKPVVGEPEFVATSVVRAHELGHSRAETLYRLDRLTAELGLDRERSRLWTIGHVLAWARWSQWMDAQLDVVRWLVGR
jgi:ATP-binding cassette subfamily B protein